MSENVRAKKHLGQHFLKDLNISQKIAKSITSDYDLLIEVGPGTGILTNELTRDDKYLAIEIDKESHAFLLENEILNENQIWLADFLKLDFVQVLKPKTVIIGNFPYNISSQILFKVYENKSKVIEVVGMFQKEVAERIASKEGSKQYGILSVLLQAFYDIEYLFTVPPSSFNPPPKVESAVIRLKRNNVEKLDCDEEKFKSIVKQSFNHRRKMLRKSLKQYVISDEIAENPLMTQRPEQLSCSEFIELTNLLFKNTDI